MGDHKGSASFHQCVKGLLNLQFGAGVNGGGGFIQNQHRRQTEHHSGNAEKLFLPLAQVIFVQDRIKTLRKAFYKFRAVCLLRRLQNFFFGGIGLSKADIVPDGAVFDPGVLQDHAVGTAQTVSGKLLDVLAVYRYTAVCHFIKAHKQVDESGFSASGGAHDGNAHTRLYLQIEMLDERPILGVTERNIGQLDLSCHLFKMPFGVTRLCRNLQKIKDSGGTGQSALQFGNDRADVVEGLHILIGIGKKHGKSSHRQASARNQEYAEKGHSGINQIVDKTGGGIGQTAEKHGLLTAFGQFFIDFGEAL